MTDKLILDACCGSRMFWWNKRHPAAVYNDNRKLETKLCDGRKLIIDPDTLCDFRNLPFPDKYFKMVIFDPPHLLHAGRKSWLMAKYGVLERDWQAQLKDGFDECMRVLDQYGTLIFKWNDDQIKLGEVLKVFGQKPLFGDKRSKTHWCVFMKGVEE
ncbi:SAM-dependent methyltransferase [Eubacterium callanderi]|uniref:SAM-dependent methyltransferase n=1 Tax=Eubacterium callanderi TaxID=53442 RepID=UPI001C2CE0E9|nr:SAM-dependent methyltransferase [Eubacterium callanderi]MBV1685554.1 SAM-dependent methyltransferase [Eubacterium callanderi]